MEGTLDAHNSNVFPFAIRIENVFLVGSVPELCNWCPDNAIPLSPANYPTWSGEYFNPGLCNNKKGSLTGYGPPGTVTLPASVVIEYKYIKKSGSNIVWASDPNWRWETPASGNATLNDNWR